MICISHDYPLSYICKTVTIQEPLYREVFWHEYAKIPRHTSQNAITDGDFKCILARNCEGTEQLRKTFISFIKQTGR